MEIHVGFLDDRFFYFFFFFFKRLAGRFCGASIAETGLDYLITYIHAGNSSVEIIFEASRQS